MSSHSEPRFERSERRLTSDEISDLDRSSRGNPGCSYLLLLVTFGLLPGWLFGLLGRWVGGWSEHLDAQWLEWIGWGLGAVIFFSSIASFRKMSAKVSSMFLEDIHAGFVEVLEVHGARALELDEGKGAGRIAIQVGSNEILILSEDDGRLFDWGMYSEEPEPESMEWCDDHFNGLPAPNGFPSTQFMIERLPLSGRVLRIRVQGEYSAPEKGGRTIDLEHGHSKWIEGDLDSLRESVPGILPQ